VPAYTLDTIFSKLNIDHVDLIKLDVEGAEVKALKGLSTYLEAGRIKRIVAEVHSKDLLASFRSILHSYKFLTTTYTLGSSYLVYAVAKKPPYSKEARTVISVDHNLVS
jgi:hypothetical protein